MCVKIATMTTREQALQDLGYKMARLGAFYMIPLKLTA
jgi:hypothetical protein